jgi:hypothetical protein
VLVTPKLLGSGHAGGNIVRLYDACQVTVEQAQPALPRVENAKQQMAGAAQHQGANQSSTATFEVINLQPWNQSMVGLNTELVVGTPVRFQGQVQYMVLPVNDEYVGTAIRTMQVPFREDHLAAMLTFMRCGEHGLEVGVGKGFVWRTVTADSI